MCLRFASDISSHLMALCFRARQGGSNLSPSWNIRPGQSARIVRHLAGQAQPQIDAFTWGLIPSFVKSARQRQRLHSLHADHIPRSRITKAAFKSQRCLVPATTFFQLDDRPQAIESAERVVMAMAGLWDIWCNPETAECHQTFTLITHPPTHPEDAAPTPVIIRPQDWPVWLGEHAGDTKALIDPSHASSWRRWPISRRILNTDANDPDLLQPFGRQEKPLMYPDTSQPQRTCC